jgi:hypothetical protein
MGDGPLTRPGAGGLMRSLAIDSTSRGVGNARTRDARVGLPGERNGGCTALCIRVVPHEHLQGRGRTSGLDGRGAEVCLVRLLLAGGGRLRLN